MRGKIIRALLISLLRADGQPMPEDSLIEATRLVCRPEEPTDEDVVTHLKDLQSEGYARGHTDELTKERFWFLSMKGTDKARQLR